MNNEMAANAHKRQNSMVSLSGSASGDDFFASVTGFDDFGNGEDDLDLMDGEDESKDSLGDLQDGTGGAARKLKRPPSTAEKKATHNAVERARRESLNGRFLVLADMLPGMNHVKRASKAAIVNKSIDLINDLRATEIKLTKETTALKQELEALRSRLAANNAGAAGAPSMPLPLPNGLQGPAAAHAAAAAAAAMMAAGHHPHTHPALAGLASQMPPSLAFQQQLHQQMQDGGMISSLNNQQQQQQPPLTPGSVQPLSAQQMHEHAAAMTMAAHQHQFLQQQHHLAQQQQQAQAQAQAQHQHQQMQQQQQTQQMQQAGLPMFPGVFNGFFNGVGLLDTLESARSESGSPTSAHSSAQQQAILGTSPSSNFAYNAAIPQLPAPAPLAGSAAAAAYFNEAALTSSSETSNNNNNSNSLHTLLGNAASSNNNNTASPPPSHYSPISFHSPSSSSTFAQQRLGSRGTVSGSSGTGNEGTAPSPASSHSVPTPPNATYSPPSSSASAILKKDGETATAQQQPASASPLMPSFEDPNAKAQADLQQYFAYQQRLASLNGQHAQAQAQAQAQAAAAAAAAMGFLPSHAAAAAAALAQQQNGNQSPTNATSFCGAQGMNIPAWQLMMAQHQALSTYGGVTGPTHF